MCIRDRGESYYDRYGELEFGVMFHGFDYPDETGQDILAARFWRPKMLNGVVQFLPPEEIPEEMKRNIRPMKVKKFDEKFGNFSGLKEETLQREFAWEGGEMNGVDAEIMRGV